MKSKWYESLTSAGELDVIPKDFYTSTEIAQFRDLSVARIQSLLRQEVIAGRVVMKKLRIKGKGRKIPHYGPAKGGKC